MAETVCGQPNWNRQFASDDEFRGRIFPVVASLLIQKGSDPWKRQRGSDPNGTWRVLKLVCWNEIDTKGPRLQSLGCQTIRQVHGGPFDVSVFVKTDSKSST